MRLHNRKYLRDRRCHLRKGMTKAEVHLWSVLKGKQLDGFKFRRQHSIGNFIVDFYCFPEKLAIELDGEYHLNSSVKEYDAKRQAYLESLGIRVLRFRNDEVIYNLDAVLDSIATELGGPGP
jgi:very-short-patch-repair endonuclease